MERDSGTIEGADLVRSLPVGVLVLDASGRVEFANESAAELLGVTVESLRGEVPPSFARVILDHEGQPLPTDRRPIRRAYDTQQRIGDMVVGVPDPRGGATRWVLFDAVPQLDDRGAVRALVCTLTDMTARREAEIQLRESQQFLTTVLSSIEEGLLVCDRDLRYQVWNRYMEELSGAPAEEVLGQRSVDVFPHLIQQGADVLMLRALEGERVTLPEMRYLHPATGALRWYTGTYSPHRDATGQIVGVVGNIHEITERKQMQERLTHDALHDNLTGLANRALFLDRLNRALERAKRHPEQPAVVLLLDLDRFKVVVDGLGHVVADRLLRGVAERFLQVLRAADTVARLGGDEFAALLEDVDGVADAIRAARRIQESLATPFELEGHRVTVSASIGINLVVPRYHTAEEVLRDADTAMYRAKAEGRGRHQVFDPSMHERALRALRLESDLRRGLDRGEFVLHYQPILSVARGHISGFEALLRWRHPERGLVPPDQFIPIAEETGLIVPLGRWALREACHQLRHWTLSGARRLSMAVNVSGRQFGLRELPREVADALGDASLDPECLHLEITEGSIVEDTDHARDVVSGLKEIGVQLHVDDFGVGYSSLSSLHRFPLDALKIDRSFVARMSDGDLEVVRTVTLLAQSLDMGVVAEGVETPEQLAQLRALRCTHAQGYLFSRPLPPDAAADLLASAPRWQVRLLPDPSRLPSG